MASYSAYKWIPWQLFCYRTDNVNGIMAFSANGPSSKGVPFSPMTALDGLWFRSSSNGASMYVPSLPNLDTTSDVDISMEFYLDGTVNTGDYANFTFNYAEIVKGPGGTVALNPTFTSITIPSLTIGQNATEWRGRIFTVSEDLFVPAYTLSSPISGFLFYIGVGSTAGVLVTGQKIALLGVGIHYSSVVMEN